MAAAVRAIAELGRQQPLHLPSTTLAIVASTQTSSQHTAHARPLVPYRGEESGQHDTEIAGIGSSGGWTTLESIWRSIVSGVQPKTPKQEKEDLDSGAIPEYVFEYAPYVHLYSGENFWPCDIADHLVHTTPRLNFTAIDGMENDRTVDNLDELNKFGRATYLQSDDNVEERPDWLGGAVNIPSDSKEGSSPKNGSKPGGYSSAPAVLVVIPKDDGIIDAFWFYFYSYNLGNKVLGTRFGNHVGDWEHTLVRFRKGQPEQVFLSEHNAGEAYAYSALEKIGKRPLTFSATGSHAMYATPGSHPYVLPLGLLHDQTDRGPLWDPRQNVYAYTLNAKDKVLRASTQTPDAPTHWFRFLGHWGDRAYPMNDSRQYGVGGLYHYVSGPLGPIYKNLWRKNICQSRGPCHIRYWLPPPNEAKMWPGGDSDADVNNK